MAASAKVNAEVAAISKSLRRDAAREGWDDDKFTRKVVRLVGGLPDEEALALYHDDWSKETQEWYDEAVKVMNNMSDARRNGVDYTGPELETLSVQPKPQTVEDVEEDERVAPETESITEAAPAEPEDGENHQEDNLRDQEVEAPRPAKRRKAAKRAKKAAPVQVKTKARKAKARKAKTARKTAPVVASDGANGRGAWPRPGTKVAKGVALLRRKQGVTSAELMKAMGYNQATVHGFIGGVKLRESVTIKRQADGTCVYSLQA